MTEPHFLSADLPVDQDGRIYHLGARAGDIAETVLLVEDPEHLSTITRMWRATREVATVRAYAVYTGMLGEHPVSACCTAGDVHGASTTVESLARLGAKTLLRVGLATSIQPDLRVGDAVIATGAARLDELARGYVVPGYPASASVDVLLALLAASQEAGLAFRAGPIATTDSWYPGQGLTGFRGYRQPRVEAWLTEMQHAGVLAVDQLTSAVFVVAAVYGLRVGAICRVQAERASGRFAEAPIDEIAAAANRSMEVLLTMDAAQSSAGARLWHPGLLGKPSDGPADA